MSSREPEKTQHHNNTVVGKDNNVTTKQTHRLVHVHTLENQDSIKFFSLFLFSRIISVVLENIVPEMSNCESGQRELNTKWL